jgi:hypothetical protein
VPQRTDDEVDDVGLPEEVDFRQDYRFAAGRTGTRLTLESLAVTRKATLSSLMPKTEMVSVGDRQSTTPYAFELFQQDLGLIKASPKLSAQ